MNTTESGSVLGGRYEMVAEDLARALAPLQLSAGAAVLDVGTGSGNCAIYLALQGYRVVTGEPATDESLYSRRDWRSAAKQVGVSERIQYQPFDASDLPFARGEFEAAFFLGVLHHIAEEDRRAVLAEALRVVKPGGAVVFLEPQHRMLEQVRRDDSEHPPAADPSQYLTGEGVIEQRMAGSWLDIFLYRHAEGA